MKLKILVIGFLLILLVFTLSISYESFEGDIPVYDKIEAVYNIGDILNTPWYWTGGNWPIKSLRSDHQTAVDYYTDSIGHIYFKNRPADEDIPNENRIRESTDEYIKINADKFKDLIDIVSKKDTLTAHIRSGDRGVLDEQVVNLIKKISNDYSKIFILSGVHSDKNWFGSIEEPKNNLKNSLDMIKNSYGDKVIFDFSDADVHLSLMRKCSNLFLHKGGFSMLGGVLFQGDNLYISPWFEPKNTEHYMMHVNKNCNVIFL